MATAYVPFRAAVGTTAVMLLDVNPARLGYVITNESTATIVYINDGNVSLSSYAHALPGGGELRDAGDTVWRGQVWAIVTSGSVNVMVKGY
jgi:hypothetical protein